MSEDRQVFVDMAVHSLETDIADLERMTSPADLRAMKSEEPRLTACLERLWTIVKTVQQKAAA